MSFCVFAYIKDGQRTILQYIPDRLKKQITLYNMSIFFKVLIFFLLLDMNFFSF